MSESGVKFMDVTGEPAPGLNLWPSVVIPKEEIDAEIARLTALPPPINGPPNGPARPRVSATRHGVTG